MKISLAEINAIKTDLAKLEPPLEAVREMPIKEVIMTLAPELQTMVDRGFTTEGLLEALKKRNISITGRSLNSYLKEFKEGRKCANDVAAPAEKSAASRMSKRRNDENWVTPDEEKEYPLLVPKSSVDELLREQAEDLV